MPAPKGNKFAIGNSGKPKMFSSSDEFQKEVDSYFQEIDADPIFVNQVSQGKAVKLQQQRPYTIEGLALHLDCDRHTLLNYEKREGYEEYFSVITRAKRRIRNNQISLAMSGIYKENFTKFIMINNSDYKDSTKVDHGSSDGSMTPKSSIVVVDKETKKELEDLENAND